jgi:hypothetical protein
MIQASGANPAFGAGGYQGLVRTMLPEGDVAQLGERLVCNQEVGGSIPLVSTRKSIFCTTAPTVSIRPLVASIPARRDRLDRRSCRVGIALTEEQHRHTAHASRVLRLHGAILDSHQRFSGLNSPQFAHWRESSKKNPENFRTVRVRLISCVLWARAESRNRRA